MHLVQWLRVQRVERVWGNVDLLWFRPSPDIRNNCSERQLRAQTDRDVRFLKRGGQAARMLSIEYLVKSLEIN